MESFESAGGLGGVGVLCAVVLFQVVCLHTKCNILNRKGRTLGLSFHRLVFDVGV